MRQRLANGRLAIRRNHEHHEAGTARAQQLAAERAGAPRIVIDPVDRRCARAVGQASLQRPAFVQELAKIGRAVRHEASRPPLRPSRACGHVGCIGFEVVDQFLGEVRRDPAAACIEQHQPFLEVAWRRASLEAKRRDRERIIGLELDDVHAAVGAGDLVLAADAFLELVLFEVDRALGERVGVEVVAAHGVQDIHQADGEGGARADSGARGQIALVKKLDALGVVVAERLQPGSHGGVQDLGNRADRFDMRPDDAMADTEERRQEAGTDVAILVDGHRQDGAAMPAIPGRIVGAAAEERNAVRRSGNRHEHLGVINLSGYGRSTGQEPVALRCHAIPPIVQQVAQGLVVGDLGFPAGVPLEFRDIRHLQVGVDRAQAIGVDFDPDVGLARREGEQRVEDVLHRAGMGAADIVVGARCRIDGDQHVVGAHGVAHVGDGAQRLQVADLDHGGDAIVLDHRDLLGEGRFGKDVAAPRPGMGEHARRHDRHAVGFGIEAADQIGADLGDGVRRCRMERALLVDRQLLPGNPAEHLG